MLPALQLFFRERLGSLVSRILCLGAIVRILELLLGRRFVWRGRRIVLADLLRHGGFVGFLGWRGCGRIGKGRIGEGWEVTISLGEGDGGSGWGSRRGGLLGC